MMNSKKMLAWCCTAAMAASAMTGAATVFADADGNVEIAVNDLAYKGELEIMHFSTSEEAEGNGGSDTMRSSLTKWDEAHPDITLVQTVLANDEFKSKIATLSAADDLPDVFLVQGMNVKSWSEQGLLYDMTDAIANSPYADKYNEDKFYPFEAGDKRWALPALTEGTCAIIAYDSALWAEAGYEEFPATWEELEEAAKYFQDQGIDTLAFGNSGKWQANSCWLSVIGDRFTGPDWTHSLFEKGGAKFTDEAFVQALQFTQDAFQSGIINADFNAVNNEEAREYYLSGDAAAFLGGNWDISYIYATADDELKENTKFAVIPQPVGASATEKTHDTGMGYGVAINAKVAEDADKLAAALDLAYEITGEGYAKYAAENYALSSLVKVDNVDLSAFDQYTQDFYHFYDNPGCEIYDSFVTGAVWEVLNTDLQSMLNGDITPEDVAANAQKAYDENF